MSMLPPHLSNTMPDIKVSFLKPTNLLMKHVNMQNWTSPLCVWGGGAVRGGVVIENNYRCNQYALYLRKTFPIFYRVWYKSAFNKHVSL